MLTMILWWSLGVRYFYTFWVWYESMYDVKMKMEKEGYWETLEKKQNHTLHIKAFTLLPNWGWKHKECLLRCLSHDMRQRLMAIISYKSISLEHMEKVVQLNFWKQGVHHVAGGLEYFAKAERNMKQLIAWLCNLEKVISLKWDFCV